jgi:hypothetical protein
MSCFRFGLKNMNPGRQIVTKGGPIQESIAEDAQNMGDDPIFSVDGDLAFNWAYDNNGCRIALTGGHLSDANVNDDNTHGLGQDFYGDPLTNTAWGYPGNAVDASVIQDCSLVKGCKNLKLQGKNGGAVYGSYAIYVSLYAETFPKPGNKLGIEIEM